MFYQNIYFILYFLFRTEPLQGALAHPWSDPTTICEISPFYELLFTCQFFKMRLHWRIHWHPPNYQNILISLSRPIFLMKHYRGGGYWIPPVGGQNLLHIFISLVAFHFESSLYLKISVFYSFMFSSQNGRLLGGTSSLLGLRKIWENCSYYFQNFSK